MSKSEESLLNVVNGAGFLFQLRVVRVIQDSANFHGWKLIGIEHRWQNSESGQGGFIDIVIENAESTRIAIECKRIAEEGSWVFLVPKPKNEHLSQTKQAQILWTIATKVERKTLAGWDNVGILPASYESSFCLPVLEKGGKDDLLLERMADTLLPSVENLANQELQIGPIMYPETPFTYIPVIVTNAKLQMCFFDTGDISLSGKLGTGKTQFLELPYIRFRKGLSTTMQSSRKQMNLKDINTEAERTMFVVNVDHLIQFLENFTFTSLGTNSDPWTRALLTMKYSDPLVELAKRIQVSNKP